MEDRLREIISQFDIAGDLINIEPLKMGHINDTYVSTWSSGQYIHQLINSYVFPNIPQLMQNVEHIISHIATKIRTEPLAAHDQALNLIPTRAGLSFLQTSTGEYWRTYVRVPNAKSFYICTDEKLAQEAAETCGRFQRYISDLDCNNFHTVIPDFHNTQFRYRQLADAVATDPVQRVLKVGRELEFVARREKEGSLITQLSQSGELQWRVTHNDLKYNNVLFDLDTYRGVAVVDLDTCMPGTLMFDFGDLIRNASVPANEDETDLTKVFMKISFFEALAKGYLGQLKEIISPLEWDLMPLAPKLLTLTIGIRFLTDYINGDKYFKVTYPEHNLDRARNQFKIVASMEEQAKEIEAVVRSVRNK